MQLKHVFNIHHRHLYSQEKQYKRPNNNNNNTRYRRIQMQYHHQYTIIHCTRRRNLHPTILQKEPRSATYTYPIPKNSVTNTTNTTRTKQSSLAKTSSKQQSFKSNAYPFSYLPNGTSFINSYVKTLRKNSQSTYYCAKIINTT